MNENNCLNKYDSYNLIHVNWNNYNTNMISKSSPCIKYDIILLFFRLFAFIYMLSTSIMFFLLDNSFTENQEINFIYLTYWSWFIDLLYYGITSFYSFYDLYNKDSNNPILYNEKRWNICRKFVVLLWQITLSIGVTVSILYYSLYYNNLYNIRNYFDFSRHFINSILIFTELLLNNITTMKSHTIILVIFGVFYSFMNYLYVINKGNTIYPILTWKDYNSVYVCILVIVVTICISFFGMFVGFIKLKIKYCIYTL